jgi:hypothetical protein
MFEYKRKLMKLKSASFNRFEFICCCLLPPHHSFHAKLCVVFNVNGEIRLR